MHSKSQQAAAERQPTLRTFFVTRCRSKINTKRAPRWLRLRRGCMQLIKSMNCQNLIERIDKVLERLENEGDIVITTPLHQRISKEIYSAVIAEVFDNAERGLSLIETSIPFLLEGTASSLSITFKLELEKAKSIVNIFYRRLLNRMSICEAAELIWHEGCFEIALLSYYCVEMKKCDGRDFEYIGWRKQYYHK